MKYLVTGVKGQLGYDVVKELQKRGYNQILGIDKEEMDITNNEETHSVISNFKPDIIIHCAAYTAVDKAEEDQDLCYKINVEGTKNIVEVASEINSKLIYISTDYVFDGSKTLEETYKVIDTPNPQSVYGKTKFQGEELVKRVKKHYICRTSWVFGKNGNNFVKTMKKLSETKDKLSVVCDQFGSPTYTVDLAKILVDMSLTDKYGTYHVNNEGYCSWAEFAEYILKDTKTTVNFVTTEEYYNGKQPGAKRPFNSKLDRSDLEKNGFENLPSWQEAIDRYQKELKNNVLQLKR